ncbi:unnamed protein product, partial [Nesidiocoris tenuis]
MKSVNAENSLRNNRPILGRAGVKVPTWSPGQLSLIMFQRGAKRQTINKRRKQVTPTIWTRVLARGRAAPAEPMFIPLRIFNSLRLAGSEGAGHATPWNTRCYCQK